MMSLPLLSLGWMGLSLPALADGAPKIDASLSLGSSSLPGGQYSTDPPGSAHLHLSSVIPKAAPKGAALAWPSGVAVAPSSAPPLAPPTPAETETIRTEPCASPVQPLLNLVADDPDMPAPGEASDPPSSPDPDPVPAEANSPADLDPLGPGDPELGIIRVRSPLEDPELGILRIREQPAPPPSSAPAKIAFLTTRFSVVSSDNVLLVENEVGGLTGDMFYRPAASVAIYPSLGPQTLLIGSLDLGLQRYGRQADINYSDWQARLALRQEISPRSYAQLSIAYQELLRTGGFRFFDNRSVGLSLGRSDPLTPRLSLDSFYQVQWSEAQSRSQTADGSIFTTDFSRLSQTAGAYLGYTPHSRWHTGLSYQINLTDYSTQDRHDTVQQLLGQVVYSLTPRVRLSLYGGRSFGRSSDPRLRFNDTIFGLTLDATVSLF